MKHPLDALAQPTAWALLALLFIDPSRTDVSLLASDKRLTLQDLRSQPHFWTSEQAKYLIDIRQLGHTPEKAIVPLLFSPQGFLINAREYNSQKFCWLRWYYTDLETFHCITQERTALPAYAKVLEEYKGGPLYAYDPYASCQQTREEEASEIPTGTNEPTTSISYSPMAFARLEERCLGFQSGDILIRPNIVLWGLFGSASVPPEVVGSGWGHAAGISRTSTPGADIDQSLKEACVIEAWGPELPREHQLRETKACVPGKFELSLKTFPVPNENYWCKKRKGCRFRLRADLLEEQRQAIAAFWRQQMEEIDGYSVFAQKRFPCSPTTRGSGCNRKRIPPCATDDWANGSEWYCSLLIWQAYYYVAGIDIDVNGGVYVFPNDIIRSSAFQNTATDQERRVRF